MKTRRRTRSMPEFGAYGRKLGNVFRNPNAPSLSTRTLPKSMLAITELRCDHPGFGTTNPIPREDAWLVGLQLRACPDHDLYFDGRLTRPENYREGVTSIYDLRRGPIADIRDPYHCLMFYLPRAALDAIAAEARRPRPGDLRHKPGVSVDDPVVRHLLSSLLPLFDAPEQVNSLFLDHVVLALTVHMAGVYAGMNASAGTPRGGLVPWQERRARELIEANLCGDLSLTRLATECGLSSRHFARAFRQSAGMPPHRWLVRQRVERARELLGKPALSLAEVASASGFADQSHLTRVFKAVVGVTPAAWRRSTRQRS